MTGQNPGKGDGDAQLQRLDDEYARIMRAFDKLMKREGEPAVEPELDPELERDLQQTLAQFLATPRPAPPGASDLDDEQRLMQALETHIRPLFDAIFATAQTHAKGAAQAMREGREPSQRKGASATLDLSGILEEDDQ